MKGESSHKDPVDKLYETICALNKKEDIKKFFEDLCTIREINDMSKRLESAYLLNDGLTYQEVTKITGLSSATLARVNKCINYGAGGYKKLLNKEK